jgi:hypothetical protein
MLPLQLLHSLYKNRFQKKKRKSFENHSLMGQLNAIAPHGTAVEAYKKYIFQYIIGKMEYVNALMPQNIRRLFLFDR